MKRTLLLATALLMLAPASGLSAQRFRGGFYAGPYWGPGWGWYAPYAYPYYGYAYPITGEVKLDTKVKDAHVFINGAFAGTTHDNKTMHLRPGNYRIDIREGERTMFSEQVYVAQGKTLKLHPQL